MKPPITLPILADKSPTLFVNEIFADTVQGEGPTSGIPAAFVRLNGCDLHCTSLPCDTDYTWKPGKIERSHQFTAEEVLQKVPKGVTVVLTGGEPLLQQRRPAFRALLEGLHERGQRVEVETAGHHVPERFLDDRINPVLVHQWNVSPKLTWSGNDFRDYEMTLPYFNRQYEGTKAYLKFVVSPRPMAKPDGTLVTLDQQMEEIHALVDKVHWAYERVCIQPAGTSPSEQLDDCKILMDWQQRHTPETGFRILPRLHILLWGNERGR